MSMRTINLGLLTTGLLCLIAASLLSGCAPRPATIPVAVPVACLDQKPERPKPLAQPVPGDARSALDLALAKLAEWTGYGEAADAAMEGCRR